MSYSDFHTLLHTPIHACPLKTELGRGGEEEEEEEEENDGQEEQRKSTQG